MESRKGLTRPTLAETLRLVALELGLRQVAAGDHLVEDLGVESMDLVSILAAVEDRWGITMTDADLSHVQTLEELHRAILEGGAAGRP